MAARSGKQYLESLKVNQPEVYLNGQRVDDVTIEPVFAGPLASIMQQYDLQHEPANVDVMTFADPDTGVRHSTSFLIPRSKEELIRRRQHFKLRADLGHRRPRPGRPAATGSRHAVGRLSGQLRSAPSASCAGIEPMS